MKLIHFLTGGQMVQAEADGMVEEAYAVSADERIIRVMRECNVRGVVRLNLKSPSVSPEVWQRLGELGHE